MNRRELLKSSLGIAGATLGGMTMLRAAGTCGITPKQTEGPFYPIVDQPDKDTDLTFVNGSAGKAVGEIITVEGVVMDQNCKLVKGAIVEVWQACHTGRYNHPEDPNPAPLDPNFQYWGKAVTNEAGQYQFRTILPGAYPADTDWIRPPHIHFKIHKLGYVELITQMYFAGQDLNRQDKILQRLSKNDQAKVVVPLAPSPDGVPRARFDISIEKI